MWMLVVQRDLVHARELLQKHRLTEAMQMLAMAEELADRSLYPEAARNGIEWTRHSIEEQRAADFYRRAQELYSRGDRSGARESLDRALEVIANGPVASACRQLLDTIDHPDRSPERATAASNPSPTPEEIAHLNRLIAAKDYEGAVEFLEKMRGNAGPEQQEWIDDRTRQIQRAIDYGRFVDEWR
jgi:tetratricopeptide (TPR) repeat protein